MNDQRSTSFALPPNVKVRPLDGEAARAVPRLMARGFGYSEADQIPPWVIQLLTLQGGVSVGAFHDDVLVGYSLGSPGTDHGQSYLMAWGMVIDPGFESKGVGTALRLAHREHALNAGYDVMRWTSASVASRILHLCLNKLGARITKLHEDLYVASLQPDYADEVEIEWRLREWPPVRRASSARVVLTRSEATSNGLRRLTGDCVTIDADAPNDVYLVEIPWDRKELFLSDPNAARYWSGAVRNLLRRLLLNDYVGTDVVLDKAARQSFLQFERTETSTALKTH